MTHQVPAAARLVFRAPRRRGTALAVVTSLVGFGLVVGPAPAATAYPAGPCGNGTTSSTDVLVTCTYASTGSEDTFTVPAGVTSVRVSAVGGWGGSWSYYNFGGSGSTLRSRGAWVLSNLAVTPAATLYVEVGGDGGSTSQPYGTTFGTGGWNGGGAGGIANGACAYGCRDIISYSGAGGGGASDVRSSPRSTGLTTESRLVVAAGGGGAASQGGTGNFFGYAGGGGDAGSAGANGYYGPGYGGGAGTLVAGGAGGAGYGAPLAQNGADGALGTGGAGGGANSDGGAYGGGGGGGGFYGGGGGGSHQSPGGGGGGSSFSSGTNTTFDLNSGAAPYISISYEIPPNQPPVITSADSAAFPAGSAGSFDVTTTAGYPSVTTLTEEGALPSGVTFTDNGDGSATLAGTPTVPGAYPVTITAGNGETTDATQTFTLTVTAPPTISSAGDATFDVGGTNSFTVTTSTGFPTAMLSATGTLPTGVTFTDNGDGTATLAGSPATGSAGSYPLTVTAANSAGSSDQSFTLTVHTIPPDTSIDSGPANDATISTSTATFGFHGTAGDTATLQCSLDGNAFADCTSPHTLTDLSNGTHTVAFRAVDATGNADPTPAQRTFTVNVVVVTPTPTPTPSPVNTFTLPATGRAHHAKGTLTLRVTLPGAGVLSLRSAGKSPVKAATVTLLGSGVAKITVKPTKAGLKMLEQSAKGKLRVNVKFTFTPTGGTANTKTKIYRLTLM